eukprot:CAMPEP_0181501202 /NCGR_PEP_ID=MMETSP1110-20121109/55662_1 /TAXON_ID=174948 /ORGANISM="Symbiodinium sp., Strain CCMP421" /LENGTH=85 /DNA_ID=CAMNT_0023629631 /DNA_START=123 /DNA_END=378 /DNA_ORIENTATION=-
MSICWIISAVFAAASVFARSTSQSLALAVLQLLPAAHELEVALGQALPPFAAPRIAGQLSHAEPLPPLLRPNLAISQAPAPDLGL